MSSLARSIKRYLDQNPTNALEFSLYGGTRTPGDYSVALNRGDRIAHAVGSVADLTEAIDRWAYLAALDAIAKREGKEEHPAQDTGNFVFESDHLDAG